MRRDPPVPQLTAAATPVDGQTTAASPSPGSTPAAEAVPSVSPGPSIAPFAEKTESLRNSDVEVRLTNRGGGISEAVLLNHTLENDQKVILNSGDRTPIGAISDRPDSPILPEFTIVRGEDGSIQFEHKSAEGVTIRKRFSLPVATEKSDNFVVMMDVDFRNDGAQPYNNNGYFVYLGSAAPLHTAEYMTPRLIWCVNGHPKNVDVGWFGGGGGFLGINPRAPQSFYQENVAGAEWAAVSNQFFATLIAPLTAKAESVWSRRFEIDAAKKMYGIDGAMRLPKFELQPGQTSTAQFQIYAGPKIYHQLAQLPHNEAEIMEFGMFKLVCQALLNALNSLNHLLGNYAAAILALTTIIKLILWPLQNKANRTARKMSLLGPKMQALREKYKDDPTKMNQEVMKLYKEYGLNPVGGCLPMLIQFPVFIGLFTMLRQAVELRHAKFLWITDLSQPDTIAMLPYLGWKVNLLPILSALTSLWMMRLTPKAGDPTQQKVMYFMPVVFVVLCYNFAAALALYYTAQNLLTILQLYLNQRQPVPTLEKVAVASKKPRKGR